MVDKFGTSANEDLIGTSGDDRLYGYGGDDRLYGKDGRDLLYGGAGNDLLDGEAGADTMFGEQGNDIYRVNDPDDIVSEEITPGLDDGGLDLVQSSITYTLVAFVERLDLVGNTAIDGTGNDLVNRIRGNDAANVLSGLAGADLITGGGGNDTLVGGADRDTLTGGTGSDTFYFGPADATSTDRIMDFAPDDWIGIRAGDYNLSYGQGLTSDGNLDPEYFATVSGSTNVQGTAFGHGQLVFNTTTLTLMWDADGAGTNAAGIPIATFQSGAVLSDGDFAIDTDGAPPPQDLPSVIITNGTPDPQIEGSLAKINFTISLSAPAEENVRVTYSTVNGTALADSDFVGTSGQVDIPAGSTSATVSVSLLDDSIVENPESFSLKLGSAQLATSGTNLNITDDTGTGNIADNDAAPSGPRVVAVTNMLDIGSTDPAGLAYVPGKGLFLSDSEVDEDPFFRSDNLFLLNTDGTRKEAFSLGAITKEPTGLAYANATDRLYIVDDDKYKAFWVDPDNPTVKLGEFLTKAVGGTDPEDLAFDSETGHIFIANGLPHTITETDANGTMQISSITLPDVIKDPEALLYDTQHDVFYVGGGFSSNIWLVDRSGSILDTIDILANYRNPISGTKPKVKDMEFAPSSDSNDDSGTLNLFVADYGNSHVNDGRLFEISLSDYLWA